MEDFVDKFQKDGFVVIENFVTDEEIDLMKKECAEIVSCMSPDEHRSIFSTKDKQLNLRDDYFINSSDKRITNSEKVKLMLKSLQFLDPVVMQSMYIFKQPFIGGEVTPHQDGSYLFTEPLKVVGFWIALDDANTENGCLAFMPGSHTGGLHGNYRLVRKESDGRVQCVYEGDKPDYDAEKFVQVPVKRGSLVLIDGLVVHQSEPNSSSQPRHVYAFHVFDSATSKWSERNWLQPSSANTFTHSYEVFK